MSIVIDKKQQQTNRSNFYVYNYESVVTHTHVEGFPITQEVAIDHLFLVLFLHVEPGTYTVPRLQERLSLLSLHGVGEVDPHDVHRRVDEDVGGQLGQSRRS